MRFVKVRLRGEELREALAAVGGLRVPTTAKLAQGERILLELSSEALSDPVVARATVRAWRPASPRLRVRAAALVELDAEDHAVLEHLRAAVLHPVHARRRHHLRVPTEIKVDLRYPNGPVVEAARLGNLSRGGALVLSRLAPPVGSELVLSLVPPGSEEAVELAGRVRHQRGDAFGLQFRLRDAGGVRRLDEVVRRLLPVDA